MVYCVVWLVYGGTMQYLDLFVTQVSPSPDLPLASDSDVTEYDYAWVCLRFNPHHISSAVQLTLTAASESP
jgi:hypothetical protein